MNPNASRPASFINAGQVAGTWTFEHTGTHTHYSVKCNQTTTTAVFVSDAVFIFLLPPCPQPPPLWDRSSPGCQCIVSSHRLNPPPAGLQPIYVFCFSPMFPCSCPVSPVHCPSQAVTVSQSDFIPGLRGGGDEAAALLAVPADEILPDVLCCHTDLYLVEGCSSEHLSSTCPAHISLVTISPNKSAFLSFLLAVKLE